MNCSTAKSLHVARGSDRHRELAASLQHDQAACIARLQATSPRGVRACIRRVAGCATSTSFASHASTEAGLELTLHLDHPMGSHHMVKHRHKPISDSEIVKLAHHRCQ